MENEVVPEEQQKKGRHRKKQLYNSIMQQMEFYFSDANLSKDKFLLPIIQNCPDVDISIFLKFNKIRKISMNVSDLVKAINNSQLLELSADKTKVRRKMPLNIKLNVDSCTIYVERIKADVTHEWLSDIFSEFGTVTYVSIPKYKHNKVNKGFAFVEFKMEEEAAKALAYFEAIGCKMSSLMAPENLCSILTFEGNTVNDMSDNLNEIIEEVCDSRKKRKCSSPESDSRKKIKIDNGSTKSQCDFEEQKKKKHKKMKKKLFKELGLQVLSKIEWKKIRNRYLDNQKTKMKQLKQFLHKKKFNNQVELKQKADFNNTGQQDDNLQNLTFVAGVIVKAQLLEPYSELKKVKEDLKQHSSEIKYVDMSANGAEVYLRFSDKENAEKFSSLDYPGHCVILEGKEEEEYWNKINSDRLSKLKKNQKHMRGREKLLKKAEKELGKHIKFDDAD